MDNTNNMGWGCFGTWFFFIIILFFFFGFGGGYGNGRFGNGFNNGFGFGNGLETALLAGGLGNAGCSRVSNCEVEKQGLITAAETNYRIIEENRKSTDAISSQLRAQWDAAQGEKIFDLKLNNVMQQNAYNLALSEKNATIERMTLANSINTRFDQIAGQIQDVKCKMLEKPNVTGVGAVCPNAGIINGLGFNGYNNGYGYGYNNGFGGCGNCGSTLA